MKTRTEMFNTRCFPETNWWKLLNIENLGGRKWQYEHLYCTRI